VFALAGGPGQPATDFTGDFAFAFADDGERDVVTFDQRGTGRSGLLRCKEIEEVVRLSAYPGAAERCAQQLGNRRGFYTTSDSVDDMEAVRREIGADKIAIYGASYGTKVATAYASRYPQHVERLILDSVVTPDGPDPLYRDTFNATPRVMRASCGGACDWTADAGGDLTALAQQLATAPAAGRVFDRRGRGRADAISSIRLLFLLLGGDFAPRIRAALPGAVYNARRGDAAPLLRLASTTESAAEPVSPREFSSAVFTATICEELAFPWRRGAPFDDRGRQAAETAARLGEPAFTPFGSAAALRTDLIALCRRWAEATPAAANPGPLPDVPALVLAGELDLRTPLEGGRRVAGALPRSTLLTVPATGHSTLGSDASNCTLRAIVRFLDARTVSPRCAGPPRALRPDRPAPLSVGEVKRLRGAPRSIARVLAAVGLTIDDTEEQAANAALGAFDRDDDRAVGGGGLRGGRFVSGDRALSLRRVIYVPGVRVSGRLLNRAGRIGRFRVGGSRKVRGVVRYRGRRIVTGKIGGRRFRFRLRQVDNTPPEIELGAARLGPGPPPHRPLPRVP
jgi:pimeloyl-ACP methyl ester carboxylesterase